VYLGTLFGLLCPALVLRRIEADQLKHDLLSIELIWILAALCAFAIEYACRIERWRRMLRHENPTIQWIECAGPLMASYAANGVLPFRAGDVLRAFGFERLIGVAPSVVVATLVVERLLDMLVLLAALSAVLVHFGIGLLGFRTAGLALLAAITLFSISILLFPRLLEPITFQLCRLLRILVPRIAERVIPEIQKGLSTFNSIASRHGLAHLFALSLAAWVCEGCIFWFAAKALSSLTFPSASWIALPMGALSTLVPGAPGYVGTFEYAVVSAMVIAGNSATAAATYSFLVHGLLSLPSIFIGGLYLLIRFTRHSSEIADL
jgi:uncharacterized protein (TIRG00374 family)